MEKSKNLFLADLRTGLRSGRLNALWVIGYVLSVNFVRGKHETLHCVQRDIVKRI